MLLVAISILSLQQVPSSVVQRRHCPASMISEPKEGCKSWNPHETAGPLIDEPRGFIYAGGSDGVLHILSSKSGRVLERHSLHGNLVSTPVQRGFELFFGTDQGYLVCFDLDAKQIKWENKIGAEILNSPILHGEQGFVVTGAGVLSAFDISTGEVLWQRSGSLPNLALARPSQPLIFAKRLVWGNASGRLEFLRLVDGELEFDLGLGDSKRPFPEIVTDPVFVSGSEFAVAAYNQGVSVIDAKTGVLVWSLPALSGVTKLASQDDVLISAGPGFVVGVDLKKQQIIWRFKFNKGSPNRVVIDSEQVYVGSDADGLYVLNLKTGRPLQVLGVRGGGFAADFELSSDAALFAMSTRGYLYNYGRKQASRGRRADSAGRSSAHYRALAQ